jgi:nucleotide-binding universal stress UspA family protein
MFRTIMVPLDGTLLAEYAINYAIGIARNKNSKLEFALVRESERDVTGEPLLASSASAGNSGGQKYFDEILRLLRRVDDLNVRATVLTGDVVQALESHADEIQANLVVMATHARRGASRIWNGSVAEALVRTLTLPVIVVRQTGAQPRPFEPRELRTVVVPLDGSSASECVLPLVTHVADPAELDLRLVRVLSPLTVRGHGEGHEPDAETRAHHQADPEMSLRKLATELSSCGARAVPVVLTGHDVGREISEYARGIGADLIAMTTHARTGVRRLVLGSEAADIMRAPHSPVLLYRPARDGSVHEASTRAPGIARNPPDEGGDTWRNA